MAKRLAINNRKKTKKVSPSFASINARIELPYFHNNPAIKKNLNPRATNEAITKIIRSNEANPENIVITLYGNGVSPANKTTQNPHLLCIVVKEENFSL